MYHLTVANLVLLGRVRGAVKRVFATVILIQFMPANHSNTNRVITILIHSDKTHFQNVVMLLRRVAKEVTSSLLAWQKRYDFNAANFLRHSQ